MTKQIFRLNGLKRHFRIFFASLLVVAVVFSGWSFLPNLLRQAKAAPTLVQTATGITNGGTTVRATFAAGATTNNLIIAICGAQDSSTLSISAPAGFSTAINQAGTPSQGIFYLVAAGGETNIDCDSTASTRLGLHIYEYSGLATSGVLDATGSATGTSSSPSSGSVTTTNANNLLIAGVTTNANTSFSAWSDSFTERNDFANGGAPGSRSTYGGADRNVTATGTYSTIATAGASGAWRGQIAAFKEPTANPVLTQNDWRLYVDNDALDPTDPWGNPDLGENTALVAVPPSNDPIDPGDEVRIRMSVAVTSATLAAGGEGFILQYKETNDCTDAAAWTDIDAAGGAGTWRFAASGVADNTALSGDPPTAGDLNLTVSDRAGRYNKSDPTSTNPFAVNVSEDLEWDWHVQYNGNAEAHTYCFRMIRDDATALNAYNSDSYPKVDTRPAATPDFMRHGNFFTTGQERGFFWAD